MRLPFFVTCLVAVFSTSAGAEAQYEPIAANQPAGRAQSYDETLIERVLRFAAEGNLEGLREVLEEHPDLANARLPASANRKPSAADAFTPLHFAARGGHRETAAYLLAKGAKIDAANEQGWTP